MDDRAKRLNATSNPRLATLEDAPALARLFASTFLNDPIFDFMVRTGPRRVAALQEFFRVLLCRRDIPQGEVWMSSDGHACTMWLPPGGRTGPGGFVEQFRLLPYLPEGIRFHEARTLGLDRQGDGQEPSD
jgi:hypothetical protein